MILRKCMSYMLAMTMLLTGQVGYAQQTHDASNIPIIVNREVQPQPVIVAPVIDWDAEIQRSLATNLDDLMCSISIPILSEETQPNFDDIQVKCWDDKPFEGSNAAEKLRKEQKVCNCLKNHRNPLISGQMSVSTAWASAVESNVRNNSNESDVQRIRHEREESARDQLRYLQNRRESYIFQASTIGNGQLLPAYGGVGKRMLGIVGMGAGSALSAGLAVSVHSTNTDATKTEDRPKNQKPLSTENKAATQESADAMAAAVMTAAEPDRKLYEEQKFDPTTEQCVSSREFLTFNQLPSDQYLYRELSKDFNPREWNYEALKTEFQNLTSLDKDRKEKHRDYILGLKAKILFLSRNPMLKAILSDYSNPPTGDDEDSKRIREAMKDLNIRQEQNDLFGILKSIVPNGGSCRGGRGSDGTCLEAATQSGLVDAYNSKLGQFFGRPTVGAYVLHKANLDLQQANDEYKMKGGSYQIRVDKIRTYDELEADFIQNTHMDGPSVCTNGGQDIATCLAIYAPFCQRLETVIAYNPEIDDLVDDLDVLMRRNLEPDISKNPDFREFNRQVCEQTRRTSAFGGAVANLSQFRSSECAVPAGKPECQTDTTGYQLLREKFYAKYKHGKDTPRTRAFLRTRVGSIPSSTMDNVAKSGTTSSVGSAMDMLGRIEENNASQNYDNYASRNNEPAISAPITPIASGKEVASSNNASPAVEDSGFNNFYNSSAMINGPGAGMSQNLALPESADKLTDEDKERIRSMAEEEIARNKREIPNAATSAERESLEAQNKMLQQLLAQKAETEAKYQQLIDELNKKNAALAAESATSTKPGSQTKKVAQSNGLTSSDESYVDNSVNRAPASAADASKFNTSGSGPGSSSGRAASTFQGSGGASSTGRGSLGGANSALLDAAIARGKVSSDGAAIIVQDADRSTASAIENASSNGSQLSLTVPAQAFAQLQNENVEVLRQYKDQILRNVDENQAVRLTVKAGDKSMNIVVLNRNGNLVYVPTRVFSLKSLNQQLRGPSGQNP